MSRRPVHEHSCGRRSGADGERDDGRLAEPGQAEPRGEAAQRALAPAGTPLERRARRASADVRTEAHALALVDRVGVDQRHRLVAGECVLELLAHGAPRPEDQRLDGGGAQVERRGDLGIAAAFELAQDERLPLVRREVAERAAKLGSGPGLLLGVGDLVELDLQAPRARREQATALVVGDRDQPVARLLHPLARADRAQRTHERRLHHVLGIRPGAQDDLRVLEHLVGVAPVQTIDLGLSIPTSEPEQSRSPATTTI